MSLNEFSLKAVNSLALILASFLPRVIISRWIAHHSKSLAASVESWCWARWSKWPKAYKKNRSSEKERSKWTREKRARRECWIVHYERKSENDWMTRRINIAALFLYSTYIHNIRIYIFIYLSSHHHLLFASRTFFLSLNSITNRYSTLNLVSSISFPLFFLKKNQIKFFSRSLLSLSIFRSLENLFSLFSTRLDSTRNEKYLFLSFSRYNSLDSINSTQDRIEEFNSRVDSLSSHFSTLFYFIFYF